MSDRSMSPYPPAGPLDRPAAVALIQQADALVGQGEYAQALVLYSRLVGHPDPELHVASVLGIAECRYRLDEDEAAMQAWELATQAPETPLAWLAWRRLAEARVRVGNLSGAIEAYREAERRAPGSERPQIQSRLGWLNKEAGNQGAANRYFGRARAGGVETPMVTWAILAVTIGIGGASLLDREIAALAFSLFGLDKEAVAQGEIYRLLSVVLVHDNRLPIHLLSNMYALFLVGPLVEGLYGRLRFLAAYLLAAAAGSTASFLINPGVDSVGASGAIFGLFGLLFVALRIHRPVLTRQARSLAGQVGFLIVLNLIIGFSFGGFIDNAAHVGGLLAGGWFGLVVPPVGATLGRMWQRPSTTSAATAGDAPLVLLRAAGLVLLVAVIAIGVVVGSAAFA
jgi:membrane associated rhomboid family serine protease